jgi:RNA polymerase sigma factor (sigma-70 family)
MARRILGRDRTLRPLTYALPATVMATDRSVATSEELEIFCRSEHPKIVGFLTLFCGDREVALELAQETMIRVVQHWKKVRGMQAPSAWAHRVAVNLANSWVRRRIVARRGETPLREVETHLDPDGAAAIAVREAIRELPPRQRAAIVLRFYADLPTDEVAEIMRCKPGTVWALTNQALASLRRAGLATEADDV